MTLTERKTPRLVENIDWKLMGRADRDNFDVINGNGIDRSSHTRCGFDDGGDGGGILRKGIAKLVEFSLLRHLDPPGRRMAFSNSVCRLISRSASCSGENSIGDLLCSRSLTHQFVAALPTAFRNVGEVQ